MADRIETADELRRVMREEADANRVDIRAETKFLRDTFGVGDAVQDWEIDDIVTETLRSDTNPEVVFVLGGGMLVAHVRAPPDGGHGISAELWMVEGELSNMHGGRVRLTPAANSAEGYGILTAYRMPAADYWSVDWPLVERFGVEIGRYRQSAERVAA